MNIYLFSDYTGMFDASRITPLYKMTVTIGNIDGRA